MENERKEYIIKKFCRKQLIKKVKEKGDILRKYISLNDYLKFKKIVKKVFYMVNLFDDEPYKIL